MNKFFSICSKLGAFFAVSLFALLLSVHNGTEKSAKAATFYNTVYADTEWQNEWVSRSGNNYMYATFPSTSTAQLCINSDTVSNLCFNYPKSGEKIYQNSQYVDYSTYSYQYIFPSGESQVHFCFNTSSSGVCTSAWTIKIDGTAPSLTTSKSANITTSSSTWIKSNSSDYISVTGYDGQSGLNNIKMYVKKAGASSFVSYDYTSGTKITADNTTYFAEGSNQIYFKATDNVGYTYTTYTYYFNIDNTAPTFTTSLSNPLKDSSGNNLYYTSNIVTITPNTDVSGTSAYLCNSTWIESTASSYACEITSTADGTTVGVKDGAGNAATQTVAVNVDTTGPTITTSVSNAVTKKETVYETQTRWLVSGLGTNSEYTSAKPYISSSSSTMIIYVWGPVWYYDVNLPGDLPATRGGWITLNLATGTDNGLYYLIPEILNELHGTIWKWAPVATWGSSVNNTSLYDPLTSVSTGAKKTSVQVAVGTKTVNAWHTSNTITIKGSDQYTSIGGYYCNGAWYSSTASSYSCKISSTALTTKVGVRDSLGNATYSTVTVRVDKTAPSITATVSDGFTSGDYIAASTEETTKATMSDSHSGLSTTYIYIKKPGDTSFKGYSYSSGTVRYATNAYFGSGINQFYYYAKDAVGNASKSPTYTLYLDLDAPTATATETFSLANVDLVNDYIYVPITVTDSLSGIPTDAEHISNYDSTYGGVKVPFDLVNKTNMTAAFTVNLIDNVGNSSNVTLTYNVSSQFDDAGVETLKNALTHVKEDMKSTLGSSSNGRQLTYTLTDEVNTLINKLTAFNVNLDNDLEIKYIYANLHNSSLENNSVSDNEARNLYSIAKGTSYQQLRTMLTSPVGLKGDSIHLIVYINGEPYHIGAGEIASSTNTALSTTFDSYSSGEVAYLGAGLGEDGTVVSFSDDATSSMAVTLGASNKIEKRDVYGELEWERAITSSGKIELKKVINNEYGILVLGETLSGNINGSTYPLKGGRDILVIRLDKEGNILFTNVVGTKGNDFVINGDMNDNRIAIITKGTEKEGSLITMNVDGSSLKVNTIKTTNSLNLASVSINANRIAVLGSTNDNNIIYNDEIVNLGNVGYDDVFVQLFTNDTLSWTRRIGGTENDKAYSVAMDKHNIYVLSQINTTLAYDNLGNTTILDDYGSTDALLIKYDLNGNIVKTSTIGGEGTDTFTQVIINNDKVIIAGLSSSSSITASHFLNNPFTINKLGEVDTMIITLDKEFIIQEGLNLNGEEGKLVQEIGINQYTEQLMILANDGIYTQKVVEDTLDFEVEYKDGNLSIKSNEEIVSATLYDGTTTYDVTNGIEIAEGAYEVKVTSKNGQVVTKVVSVSEPTVTVTTSTNNTTIPTTTIVISAIAAIITLLTVLFVIKRRHTVKA